MKHNSVDFLFGTGCKMCKNNSVSIKIELAATNAVQKILNFIDIGLTVYL